MLRLLRRNIIWMALLIVLGVWSLDTAQAAESPAGVVEGVRVGEVSVGADHACAIRTTGELVCWGDNSQAEGTPPAGLFVQVSAGSDFTCAIRDDGTLACWGTNGAGQHDAPTGLYREVSAGADHACAIRDDGVALCWGADTGTIPSDLFVRLAAGDGFTCGLIDGFTLTCWGTIAAPPSGHYSQLSAGTDHACAIRDDGLPQCWGSDAGGKATPAAGVFVQLSAGAVRTCGVRDDGVAVCWGSPSSPPSDLLVSLDANTGTCGIKGDGTLTCWDAANLQTPPSGTFTRRIQTMVNLNAGCVITENGITKCIFDTPYPYSVITSTVPLLELASKPTDQALTCGLQLDRALKCWALTNPLTPTLRFRTIDGGGGAYGEVCGVTSQSAIRCFDYFDNPFPGEQFIDVVLSYDFLCGLRSNGSVNCQSYPNSLIEPPPVPADRRYIQLTGLKGQACGLKADGTVECWQSDTYYPPPPLPTGHYIQVTASNRLTCGLRSDRHVTCAIPQNAPLERYTSIMADSLNVCGVRVDTLIECWGAEVDTSIIRGWLTYLQPHVIAIPINAPIRGNSARSGIIATFRYGLTPMQYTILEGSLPEGISVDVPFSTFYQALFFTGTTTLTTQQTLPSITVQVTDQLNFVETKPFTVIVAHQPLADAGIDQQVMHSSTVQLNGNGSTDPLNTPALPIQSYLWTQTGGPSVKLSNDGQGPTPTFKAPATDAVLSFQLRVINGYWIYSYPDTVVITVSNGPVTNLQAGVRLPAATSESVPFTATAQGNNITYAWSFGDGGTATGATPSHTYAAAGTYTAIVTATNGTGTLSQSLSVPVRSRPVAHAGADQLAVVGAITSLDGSASSDPANQVLQFGWRQTSGPPVTLTNPTSSQPLFVAPSQPAILDFTLVVTNTSGLADLSPDAVRVTVGNTAITGLDFTHSTPQIVGTTISFTATVTSGSNVTYAWNFGDGTTGTGIQSTHSYTQAGTYTVTLKATNSRGSQSVAQHLKVAVGPVAITGLDFTSSAPHTLGITTHFTATIASGSNVTYAWNFGDGTTGTGIQPTHSYAQPGTYTVTVTATNSLGSQSVAHQLVIQPATWRIYTPFVMKASIPRAIPQGVVQAATRLFR